MICDQTQKRFKKPVKSVSFIECLNVARVLKLLSSGSLFQAFITRSQKNNAISHLIIYFIMKIVRQYTYTQKRIIYTQKLDKTI